MTHSEKTQLLMLVAVFTLKILPPLAFCTGLPDCTHTLLHPIFLEFLLLHIRPKDTSPNVLMILLLIDEIQGVCNN